MFTAILICIIVLAVAAVLYFRNKRNELVVTNHLAASPAVIYLNEREREDDIVVYSYERFQRGDEVEIHGLTPIVNPVQSPLVLEKKAEDITNGQYRYHLKLEDGWLSDGVEDEAVIGVFRFHNEKSTNEWIIAVRYKKVITFPHVDVTLEKIVAEDGSGNTFGLKVTIPADMPLDRWSMTGTYKVADKGEDGVYGEVNGKFKISGFGDALNLLTIDGVNDLVYKGDGLFVSSSNLRGVMDKRKSRVTYGYPTAS